MEHQASKVLTQQEIHGWYFNESKAQQLESILRRELEQHKADLRRQFPYVAGNEFIPRRDNRTQGYIKGAPLTRLKELNPSSRDHIAWILTTHYGWKPSSMTSTGKVVVDEPILKDIGSETAMKFYAVLDLTKKLGMLSEGNNAWLKLVTKSRIHHHCSVATNTHRCAHKNPNLAQVPSDDRFRDLFEPTPGNVMVGADLSGIELRMLSHYLARYDGGRYTDILLNGDIHQVNADKIGISRKLVKNVTYAFLYGAGNLKIGYTYDKQLSENTARKKGKEIRDAFVNAIPGLAELLDAVKKSSSKGYIKGIDGRKIHVDASFKALNYLLQGSAGIVAKQWLVLANKAAESIPDTHQLAFVHDELQYETPEHLARTLASSLVLSAEKAGQHYNLRIPIGAEAKIGNTWAEVH